ncbi:hypothetical protein B6228_04540 [Candidatus Atribacteria bacterium 4572_76]|nr:MAG: hypothetical protein B6228_04540 [Candidatus Atribacteria bacterium 4572_76]
MIELGKIPIKNRSKKMIELGKIPIKYSSSIVEARNKIYLLAEDLKFGSMSVTRLATITSDHQTGYYYFGFKPQYISGRHRIQSNGKL